MTLRIRVEPIDRDIKLAIDEMLSPQARSRILADYAQGTIAEGDDANLRVLGRKPPRQVWVDGRNGAQLKDVKPEGVIVAEWDLIVDVLLWIAQDLIDNSPVGRTGSRDVHPGLYRRSHTLFADQNEIPVGEIIPPAQEYVFMNLVPYARKIEQGESRQFEHVYETTAKNARSRFGNIAKIGFTFRGIVGGMQINPAVSAHMRRQRGRIRAHNRSENRFPAITVRY
jgi:hypothetical protein